MTVEPSGNVPRGVYTHHLFTPPTSRTTWEARKKELRTQILFSAGLWPMPPKMPLNPLVTGKIEGPGYTIENVALETMPGFYLCGNLYRPRGKSGPFPAIANPHGHWEHGRLEVEPDVATAAPPPAPPAEGKGNLVAIGVNLARQGFVVFAYDMVGYNDTSQVDHKFAGSLRPWLWNASLLGLQLWNSIRVVDYLESLPDVDRHRIGVTGASGGGTQTFLLTGVDDRIAAAVPVNMVSAHMQGGCLCENAPGLRVGTDNVEVAAMIAPKPLLLVAATGDWTQHNPTEEWPAIQKVYDLYGARDHTAVRQFNYQHNYNVESREAMYAWFGRWLLHDSDPSHFREQPFEVDTQAMRVWTDAHPMPSDALKEPALIQAMIDRSEQQLAAIQPHDAASERRFCEIMRPALRASLSVETHPAEVEGSRAAGKDRAVLIVACEGEAFAAQTLEESLTKRGVLVVMVTLPPVDRSADRLWADFYSCYNRTPLGDRVQQVVDWLASHRKDAAHLSLVGLGHAGAWTLLAAGASGGAERMVIDAAGLDNRHNGDDAAYIGGLYAPGLRRAGDLRTAALLAAPAPLLIFNTGDAFNTDAIAATYHARHASLRIDQGAVTAQEIADWLVR